VLRARPQNIFLTRFIPAFHLARGLRFGDSGSAACANRKPDSDTAAGA
jgi:hypothetical protein